MRARASRTAPWTWWTQRSEVVQVLHANNERVRELIRQVLPGLAEERACGCSRALEHAVVS